MRSKNSIQACETFNKSREENEGLQYTWKQMRSVLGKAIPYANYITQQDVVSMGIINQSKERSLYFPI